MGLWTAWGGAWKDAGRKMTGGGASLDWDREKKRKELFKLSCTRCIEWVMDWHHHQRKLQEFFFAGMHSLEGPGADWPAASCHHGLIDDSAMALETESFMLFCKNGKRVKIGRISYVRWNTLFHSSLICVIFFSCSSTRNRQRYAVELTIMSTERNYRTQLQYK